MNSYKRGSVFVRAFGGEVSTLSFGFLPPNDNNFVFIFWMIFTLENNAWQAGIKFSEWWVMTFASQQFNALVNFMKVAVLKCVLKL